VSWECTFRNGYDGRLCYKRSYSLTRAVGGVFSLFGTVVGWFLLLPPRHNWRLCRTSPDYSCWSRFAVVVGRCTCASFIAFPPTAAATTAATLAYSHAHSHLVVMLRRVLVVAGLEQLSRSSASLARSQCRLLLASRSSPSAPLLDKLRLHHGTKPLHRLSAAHCFSSSTTTSTVRGATLSQSINQSSWREVSMHVSH